MIFFLCFPWNTLTFYHFNIWWLWEGNQSVPHQCKALAAKFSLCKLCESAYYSLGNSTTSAKQLVTKNWQYFPTLSCRAVTGHTKTFCSSLAQSITVQPQSFIVGVLQNKKSCNHRWIHPEKGNSIKDWEPEKTAFFWWLDVHHLCGLCSIFHSIHRDSNSKSTDNGSSSLVSSCFELSAICFG